MINQNMKDNKKQINQELKKFYDENTQIYKETSTGRQNITSRKNMARLEPVIMKPKAIEKELFGEMNEDDDLDLNFIVKNR